MKNESKLDLGNIQIHKKVIADIAYRAAQEVEGVSLATADFTSNLLELFGKPSYPGVNVFVDKNSNVVVQVKITVRYGLSIPETARHVQDAVRVAIEKTVDINLKDVNVNIQGIERGTK